MSVRHERRARASTKGALLLEEDLLHLYDLFVLPLLVSVLIILLGFSIVTVILAVILGGGGRIGVEQWARNQKKEKSKRKRRHSSTSLPENVLSDVHLKSGESTHLRQKVEETNPPSRIENKESRDKPKSTRKSVASAFSRAVSFKGLRRRKSSNQGVTTHNEDLDEVSSSFKKQSSSKSSLSRASSTSSSKSERRRQSKASSTKYSDSGSRKSSRATASTSPKSFDDLSSEDEDDGVVASESNFGTFITDTFKPFMGQSVDTAIDFDTVDPSSLHDLDLVRKYSEHWRKKALEAHERAELESNRARVARERTSSLHITFESQVEQLRNEARQREEAIEAQRTATAAQLNAAVRRRRMSLQKTSSMQRSIRELAEAEVAKAAAEIEALKAKLAAVEKALSLDIQDLDWDGTLESAEEGLRNCARILMNEEASPSEHANAQYEFDKWDKIVRNHADFQKREEDKWKTWESENDARNKQALQIMRKFVPREIETGIHVQDLISRGLSRDLAVRIHKHPIFRFYYMPKSLIAKVHVADLVARYATQGLDIVELRAVYYCLPDVFDNDRDGKKAAWRHDVRMKLFNLTELEAQGKLMGSAKRHSAYLHSGTVGAATRSSSTSNYGTSNPDTVSASGVDLAAASRLSTQVTREAMEGIQGLLSGITGWFASREEESAEGNTSNSSVPQATSSGTIRQRTAGAAPSIVHKVSQQYVQHNHASQAYHASGEKSALRAAKLGTKMDLAIEELIEIIRRIGKQDPEEGGKISVTFGELFVTYENVNDMLVGILSRAKKRGLVSYDGEMLFQRRHDHVKIVLLSKS